MRVLAALHPHQHLVWSVFLISAILLGVRSYLTVVLIHISLMIPDTEHLFISISAISITFVGQIY